MHYKIKEDTMIRVAIIQRIIDKKMTRSQGAEELNLSVRQIGRLKRLFKKEGAKGLIPKQKPGRPPFSQEFKGKVMELVKMHYHDFGPKFAAQKLEEVHRLKVSAETLRGWMIEADLWKAKKSKQARIHQSRPPREKFGELIQIDGSHHDWFEGRGDKCCLLVFVDDATRKIITMRFEESETTFGYMNCVKEHLSLYGKPLSYYSDQYSIFLTTRKSGELFEDTQFVKALKLLKIEHICARSPQEKGRVERCNSTLQDRLVKEMRLRGINGMEAANAYLPEFIKDYNQRFGVTPGKSEDAHRPVDQTALGLEFILSKSKLCKVTKNLEFVFENTLYQIKGEDKGRRLQQGSVMIYALCTGQIRVFYNQREVKVEAFATKTSAAVVESKDLNSKVDKISKELSIKA